VSHKNTIRINPINPKRPSGRHANPNAEAPIRNTIGRDCALPIRSANAPSTGDPKISRNHLIASTIVSVLINAA